MIGQRHAQPTPRALARRRRTSMVAERHRVIVLEADAFHRLGAHRTCRRCPISHSPAPAGPAARERRRPGCAMLHA